MKPETVIVKSVVSEKKLAELDTKLRKIAGSYIEEARVLDGIRCMFRDAGDADGWLDHVYQVHGLARSTAFEKILAGEMGVKVQRAGLEPPPNMTIALTVARLPEEKWVKTWRDVLATVRGVPKSADVEKIVADTKMADPEGRLQVLGTKALKGMEPTTAKEVLHGVEKKIQDDAPPAPAPRHSKEPANDKDQLGHLTKRLNEFLQLVNRADVDRDWWAKWVAKGIAKLAEDLGDI